MFNKNNIIRSKKQDNVIIPYIIKEIKEDCAICVNLIDTYDYTIPIEDLYLWIIQEE